MPKQGQSPETRDVKQYKTYTLYANVVKVLGKKDGKEVTRTDRVAIAVFNDKAALDLFMKEEKSKRKGQTGYEVGEDWSETKFEDTGFDLPRNPVPNASDSDAEAKEDAQRQWN